MSLLNMVVNPSLYPVITEVLIAWYRCQARDLPWRRTHDPYAIWVSEIMLQQTQVKTVLPYYARFMADYPTVHALANAHLDEVLKHWEGLGYYARCRNMHKAAKQIMQSHAGVFPQTITAAMALPGVGQSTAGAILTFAYGQAHPILDGNVKRVLSRLFALTGTDATWTRQLWAMSLALVNATPDVYHLNQALMELGATHCSRSNPNCLLCPLQAHCLARLQGRQDQLPQRVSRKPIPHYSIGGAVIWHQGRVLIQQRAPEGLLGGLWEFPGGKQEPGETIEHTVHREIMEELGLTITLGQAYTPVPHAFTHFKITLHLFDAQCVQPDPKPQTDLPHQWVLPTALGQFAFPRSNHPVIQQLLQKHGLAVV
jgi:A/G-specific adenine glycosylase